MYGFLFKITQPNILFLFSHPVLQDQDCFPANGLSFTAVKLNSMAEIH